MPPTNIRNIKRSVDFSKDDGNIKFGYAEFEISVKHLGDIWPSVTLAAVGHASAGLVRPTSEESTALSPGFFRAVWT